MNKIYDRMYKEQYAIMQDCIIDRHTYNKDNQLDATITVY